MKVTAIAGGVGGAKLIAGLVKCLSPEDLTIIVNTGDDFNFLNLKICPDVDTISYTLAGISNPETGWGLRDETWNALNSIRQLGGPDWFQLGDKDIGTHIERTRRLLKGESLSQVIHHFCDVWGIKSNILPMTDATVSTIIRTIDRGDLSFQDYFVKYKCEPIIRNIRFRGIRTAKPAPGVLASIDQADLIVFCPSNPWVSIDPVLSVRGILSKIREKPTIAVSPIIEGKALKGPAAKMCFELGIAPSVLAVADHYKKIIKALVFDQLDANYEDDILKLGIIPFKTNTRMLSSEDRIRLAQDVLNFSERIIH
jgi:LPPG:FO 2-phospho-L-lactate transferase